MKPNRTPAGIQIYIEDHIQMFGYPPDCIYLDKQEMKNLCDFCTRWSSDPAGPPITEVKTYNGVDIRKVMR